MPPRRGINADYQQVGFGGLSFATNLNFANMSMSYEQRLWVLRGLYAFAVAKNENDESYKDNKELTMLSSAIRILLTKAGEDYQSRFESHETTSKQENAYCELLFQIFEKITQMQSISKMIEKEHLTQEIFA
jgi:hypothetical protein